MKDRFDFLDEAARLTGGDRNLAYGAPWTNHERIAKFWSNYLGIAISPEQVAVCMVLLKVARLMERSGSEARDTFTDLTAYAAISGELSLQAERHSSTFPSSRSS